MTGNTGPVLFADGCVASAAEGVIHLSLLSRTTSGASCVSAEIALTPAAATLLTAELMRALKAFQAARQAGVVPIKTLGTPHMKPNPKRR